MKIINVVTFSCGNEYFRSLVSEGKIGSPSAVLQAMGEAVSEAMTGVRVLNPGRGPVVSECTSFLLAFLSEQDDTGDTGLIAEKIRDRIDCKLNQGKGSVCPAESKLTAEVTPPSARHGELLFAVLKKNRDESFAGLVESTLQGITGIRPGRKPGSKTEASGRKGQSVTAEGAISAESKSEPASHEADRVLEQINGLIGCDAFKKEMKQIRDMFMPFIECGRKPNAVPVHYIFRIDRGMGISTSLKLLGELFHSLQIIGKPAVREISLPAVQRKHTSEYNEILNSFLERNISHFKGVLCIDMESYSAGETIELRQLLDRMLEDQDGCVYVFRFPSSASDGSGRKAEMSIRDLLHVREIDFKNINDASLKEYIISGLDGYGYKLPENAGMLLEKVIENERSDGFFHYYRTAEKVLQTIVFEKLRMGNTVDNTGGVPIEYEELSAIVDGIIMENGKNTAVKSGWDQLNEMVGLEDVKKKVREIAAVLNWSRKAAAEGLQDSMPNYHMVFCGNPGTGKTEVARIVGRIFREIGLLKVGGFFEATRKDLVAQFVGHTAPKTAAKVDEALGSVLFIDEAYSLVDNGSVSYGDECINTLMTGMDNHRNDMVVIFAGYKDQMEGFLSSNPGLKSRIPHYLEFPDYNADELAQIFLSKIAGYIYDDVFIKKVKDTFEYICAKLSGTQNFGNGRLVRNIVERMKMKMALRLENSGITSGRELRIVLPEDLERALEDKDIANLLDGGAGRNKVGFSLL